jgi:hypothetical protein
MVGITRESFIFGLFLLGGGAGPYHCSSGLTDCAASRSCENRSGKNRWRGGLICAITGKELEITAQNCVQETVMKNWTGIALCVGLLAACTAAEDRISFDGQFYNAKLRKVERQLDVFTVSVRPVSKSLRGALEAGSYEAVGYCVNQFGTSDVIWTAGPAAPRAQLAIERDTLILQGLCPDAR